MSEDLRTRLHLVLGPGEPEVTCEACFEELDRYIELERAGHDAERAVPGMRAHLHGCPACADDHAALHALLDADDGRP